VLCYCDILRQQRLLNVNLYQSSAKGAWYWLAAIFNPLPHGNAKLPIGTPFLKEKINN